MFWKLKPVWIVKPLTANPWNQPWMCRHLTFVSSFTLGGVGEEMQRAQWVRALHCWAAASGDWLMVSLLGERCEGTLGREGRRACELEGDVLTKPPLLSLQEFRQKSLDWEKQRLQYQQQVASLEAQRKALAEHSELVQVQLMCAQSVCFLYGREGEADEISQAPIQFRLPLKWLLVFQWNKVCLYECCMEKRSGVCHQRLDKPCAALPATPLVSREDSRIQIPLGGRDHSIWHFKISVPSYCLSWKLCACQQLNTYLVGPAQRVLLENSLPQQQRLPQNTEATAVFSPPPLSFRSLKARSSGAAVLQSSVY